MKVVEVNDVILDVLRARDDVADQASVVRDLNAKSVLDGADRGQRVHGGADAADALRPDPAFARSAPAQDQFDPAEHGAGAPGIRDAASVDLRLDAEVAFNASDRINDHACHLNAPPYWALSSAFRLAFLPVPRRHRRANGNARAPRSPRREPRWPRPLHRRLSSRSRWQ